jgi:hypothetical protein
MVTIAPQSKTTYNFNCYSLIEFKALDLSLRWGEVGCSLARSATRLNDRTRMFGLGDSHHGRVSIEFNNPIILTNTVIPSYF